MANIYRPLLIVAVVIGAILNDVPFNDPVVFPVIIQLLMPMEDRSKGKDEDKNDRDKKDE
jgi:hypothetical protein